MTSEANRRAISDLYQSFLYPGPDPTPVAYNDDSLWVELGDNLRAGSYRGSKAIIKHVAKCFAMTDETCGVDIQEMLVGDSYVVVIERTLALRNGVSLNMLCTTVFEMADGVVINGRTLPFDPVAWDAFWS